MQSLDMSQPRVGTFRLTPFAHVARYVILMMLKMQSDAEGLTQPSISCVQRALCGPRAFFRELRELSFGKLNLSDPSASF